MFCLHLKYSHHLNTGPFWYSNGDLKTGLKKTDYGPRCTVFEWSTKSSDIPFEYQTPILSGIQMIPVFSCSVFRWLLLYLTSPKLIIKLRFFLDVIKIDFFLQNLNLLGLFKISLSPPATFHRVPLS